MDTLAAGRDLEDPKAKSEVAAQVMPLIADAVSYTHLRAHETVLDLVCRLLLENKKLNQQHNNDNNLMPVTDT